MSKQGHFRRERVQWRSDVRPIRIANESKFLKWLRSLLNLEIFAGSVYDRFGKWMYLEMS